MDETYFLSANHAIGIKLFLCGLMEKKMLSQKCKYALQALLVLARENSDELLLVSDIAERENLPN